MTSTLPVPSAIWRRFVAFLADERSGTITLHVRGGRVRSATISEQLVPPAPPVPPVPPAVVDSSRLNGSAS